MTQDNHTRTSFTLVILLALALLILLLTSLIGHAQQNTGPMNTPQLNTDFFVGSTPGFYGTIQAAVTKACAGGGARVVIPAGKFPSDSPTTVSGCPQVSIEDRRQSPSNNYLWNPTGSIYQLVQPTASTAAGTATTPGTCPSGQYARGINQDFSAAGCTTPPSGGGGAAGNPQDVQFAGPSATFNADPGRITYNVPSHTLGTNINAQLNTDLYNTANNGIANALAATECGPSCAIKTPINSTDSETIPIITNKTGYIIDSDRGGARVRVAHNPTVNPTFSFPAVAPIVSYTCNNRNVVGCDVFYQDTPDPNAASLVAGYFHHASTFVNEAYGWSFGNAPGVVTNAWASGSDYQIYDYFNSSGISQALTRVVYKYANGDFAAGYTYAYTDGGADGYSDEGEAGETMQTGETPNYFHGLVGGTSGQTFPGATSLPLTTGGTSTISRNATGAGSFLIDISKIFSTANPTNAVYITGATTSIRTLYPSLPGTTATPQLIPIDTAVTPSTAYGPFNCTTTGPGGHASADMDILNVNNPQAPKTLTCKITKLGGSGDFADGLVYIAGDFPEQVPITGTVNNGDGTYTTTITYKNPHGANYSVIFQGSNVQGYYMSIDQYSNIAAPVISNGTAVDPNNPRRLIYPIAGATDANTLAVTISNLVGVSSPWVAPINLTNVSKTGTTITATYATSTDAFKFNQAANAVLSNCPDFAGAVTAVTVNSLTQQITMTQPAGGTSCPGNTASIDLPQTTYGAHLYPGARVVGPAINVPGTATLEANSVGWTQGDAIEEPHHPMWAGELKQLTQQVYNAVPGKPRSHGIVAVLSGAAISGTYRPLRIVNFNPCFMYSGCGGILTPVPYISLEGFGSSSSPNAGLISASSAPLRGAPIFSTGCVPTQIGGCSNPNPIVLYSNVGISASQIQLIPNPGSGPEWNVGNLAVGNPNLPQSSVLSRSGNIDAGSLTLSSYQNSSNQNIRGANFRGSITFWGDSTTPISRIGLCSTVNPKQVVVGICTRNGSFDTSDGELLTSRMEVMTDVEFGTGTGANDTFLSRLGVNSLGLGNAAGGSNGALSLGTLNASTGIVGPGSGITAINASNIGSGTLAGARMAIFTSSTPGAVPASGGGTANFMRADGTWAAPAAGTAKVSITLTTSSIGANSCEGAHTQTLSGLSSSSSLAPTPNSDPSGLVGWGPGSPGLWLDIWPSANTVNWKVCNNSSSALTPGGAVVANIGAIL